VLDQIIKKKEKKKKRKIRAKSERREEKYDQKTKVIHPNPHYSILGVLEYCIL